MNPAGGYGDDARAEMPGAGDVVGRIADDDELSGLKLSAEMFVDTLRGDRRQIAPLERLVAKRAGQREKSVKAGQLQLQMRGGLDVAGEQRRSVAGVFVYRLQDFARAGHSFQNLIAVAASAFHIGEVAGHQLVSPRDDMLARDACAAQGFFDNLQIRHAGNYQVVQTAGGTENFF